MRQFMRCRPAMAFLASIAMAATPIVASAKVLDELKFGVSKHDVNVFGNHTEKGIDLTAEILFASPSWLEIIGAPRPHVGGHWTNRGYTSQGYVGLTWTTDVFEDILNDGDGVFVAFGLGGALHNGNLDANLPRRKKLGTPVLFRLSAEAGYRFTPDFSISVLLDHESNADLGSHNEGLNNLGIRAGIKF